MAGMEKILTAEVFIRIFPDLLKCKIFLSTNLKYEKLS
jgi:hypothetical protein